MYNNGYPIKLNLTQKNNLEQMAYDFSEGNEDLKNILMLLWESEIKTKACCSGHEKTILEDLKNNFHEFYDVNGYLSICVDNMNPMTIDLLIATLISNSHKNIAEVMLEVNNHEGLEKTVVIYNVKPSVNHNPFEEIYKVIKAVLYFDKQIKINQYNVRERMETHLQKSYEKNGQKQYSDFFSLDVLNPNITAFRRLHTLEFAKTKNIENKVYTWSKDKTSKQFKDITESEYESHLSKSTTKKQSPVKSSMLKSKIEEEKNCSDKIKKTITDAENMGNKPSEMLKNNIVDSIESKLKNNTDKNSIQSNNEESSPKMS